MKQPEDKKTLELILEEAKRGRGRPKKAQALTGAERAKLYRDRNRAANIAPRITPNVSIIPRTATDNSDEKDVTIKDLMMECDRLKARTIKLTMQYDVEHVQRMEAERALANQIDSYRNQEKTKVNPLAEKMKGLKNELADAKRVTQNLRDALDQSEASQKMLIEKEEKMALYIETLTASITKKRTASRKIDQDDHVEAAITKGELTEAKAAIRKATK